jgi:gluconate 2-dehydrogenase gamma chain
MSDPSRRDLFRQAGAASAVAAITGAQLVPSAEAIAEPHVAPTAPAQLEALESLTALEADTLQAIVARLIPADENGPGAAEAGAAHYVDRALSGPLRSSREAYAAGLAALDAYALTSKGAAFVKLSADQQDAILADLEMNAASGFSPDAATFFNLVRTHTIQGTFCDPYYGGNTNFIGWDLIGYPGIRMAVGDDEQGANRLRKKVFEGGRYATLIQIRGRWRTKDSNGRHFGF